MEEKDKAKIVIVGTPLSKTSYLERVIEDFKLQDKIEIKKITLDECVNGTKPDLIIYDDIEFIKGE